MTQTHSTLAKISPPRLGDYYVRQRLFESLDNARKRPVIWISAPAGAGKTTLVKSYLEYKKIKPHWYQVDEGDHDIASFFYYLGLLGKQAAPRRKKQLPLLTPEYLLGLPTFARNFFRELFSRLKAPGVLVLDNYQEVQPDSQLHDLLAIAFAEIPEGINVIVISRSDPPPVFTRLRASQIMNLLGWEQLRLMPEETAGLGQLRCGNKPIAKQTLDKLHSQTGGWVAGVVLLLEQDKDLLWGEAMTDPENHAVIFDYFTNELFCKAEPVSQQFLLRTALLPKFTASTAMQLTGNEQTEKILSDFIRRNFFTVRHMGSPPSYEYHPLFREFLQNQGREIFSAAELAALQFAAAQLLQNQGQIEEAAALFIALQNVEQLTLLISQHGRSLVQTGKWQTLLRWYNAIPAEVLATQPWLLFWLASATMPMDLFKARDLYKQALEMFVAQNDPVGAYLSWAGGVDTFLLLWADFHPLDEWIDQFTEIHERWPQYPNAEIEARVTYGMFTALMWRQPDHPELHTWLQRAEVMLHKEIDPGYRIMLGVYLLFFYIWWLGNLSKAELLVKVIEPLARSTDIGPLAQLMWKYIEAQFAAATDSYQDCIKAVEEGLGIANESGVYVLNFTLHSKAVYGAFAAGKLEVARVHLEQMAPLLQEKAYFDRAHYHYLCSWLALLEGDLSQAREQAQHGLDLGKQAGGAICCPFLSLTMAQVLTELGEHQQSAQYLQAAEQWGQRVGSASIKCHSLLNQAYLQLTKADGKQSRDLSLLQEALNFLKSLGYVSHLWIVWRRDVMLQLYTEALQHNIEVEYVQSVIRKRQLIPRDPPLHINNWPWQLRIYTLGRFSLLLNNETVVFKGKAQKRPLELIKTLIALGGRDVAEDTISEALWPDADGDAAHSTFNTTLYRVRKLLGDDVLRLSDGKLTLNSTLCWVDVWACERLFGQLEHALQNNDSAEDSAAVLQQILDYYHGPFLKEEGSGWVLSLRERLKTRLLRAIDAQILKETNCSRAIALYERAIQIDDLAEHSYQGLMACLAAQGNYLEALAVYERCRQLFQATFEIEPSQATQQLAADIKAGDITRVIQACPVCDKSQ